MVTDLCRRNPDTGKSSLDKQSQDVSGVAAIRLLLAHVASTDLGWISNPNLMAQCLQQLNKPLIVADSLDAHKSRRSYCPIELLSFTGCMCQFVLLRCACLGIEERDLLVAGVEIAAYYDHPGSFLPRD